SRRHTACRTGCRRDRCPRGHRSPCTPTSSERSPRPVSHSGEGADQGGRASRTGAERKSGRGVRPLPSPPPGTPGRRGRNSHTSCRRGYLPEWGASSRDGALHPPRSGAELRELLRRFVGSRLLFPRERLEDVPRAALRHARRRVQDDRGVGEVVEPQAFHDGPDGPREGVRRLPTLGGHSTRPPPEPCAPLDTGERISRFGTDARGIAEAQMPQPNCFFAVSDIISGVHGGSQTMSTFASLIPGSCSSFRFTSWWMYADAGQPGAVSVILTSTLPSSPLRSMLYTRPRS